MPPLTREAESLRQDLLHIDGAKKVNMSNELAQNSVLQRHAQKRF